MENKFMIRDGHIIVNPNMENEKDITEEGSQCGFCGHMQGNFCGYLNKEVPVYGKQKHCNWLTVREGYKEVTINNLSKKELDVVIKQMEAFESHYEYLAVMKYNNRYFIFVNEEKQNNNEWIYSTDKIEEVRGWLYAAVQAILLTDMVNNRKVKSMAECK